MSRFDTKARGEKFENIVLKLVQEDVGRRIEQIGAKKEYAEFCASLMNLKLVTDDFYRQDKHGAYILLDEENNLARLKKAYRTVMKNEESLRAKVEQSKDKMGDMFGATISTLSDFESEIAPDISVLSTYASDEKLSLPELMYRSGVKTYDISDVKEESVGGKQSSRMAVEIVDSDGKNVKGFFTKNSTFDPFPYFAEEADIIRKKYEGKFPESVLKPYNRMVDEIIRTENGDAIFLLGTKDQRTGRARTFESFADNKMNLFSGLPRSHRKLLSDMLFDLTQYVMENEKLQESINHSRRMTYGANIDRRNSAMSDIASLLGVRDLIAESEDIKVKNADGEIIEGTFMELAEGVPIEAVKFTGKEEQFTPALKKQISDLQILDYICFNVDRHLGNVFFKMDQNNNIVGVVGIDNDASFGDVSRFERDRLNRLTNIPYLKFMSVDMANKLQKINPDAIKDILRARGIPENEIKAAVTRFKDCKDLAKSALKRTDNIKSKRLDEKGYTVALSDEGFAAVKLAKFPKMDHEERNIFASLFLGAQFGAKHSPEKFNPIDMSDKKAAQTDMGEKTEESLKNSLRTLKEYREKLKNATGIRGTSKNYTDMQDALDNSIEFIEDTLSDKRVSKMNVTMHEFAACIDSMKKVYEAADHYAVEKEKEEKRSSYANKRLNLAKEFKDTLTDTLSRMEYKQDMERDEMEVMNINKITSGMLEDILKTEDALKEFGKEQDVTKKANLIFTKLPKLSSQAYASFDGKIDELLDKDDLLSDETLQRLSVAKTISGICKKGREATSILAVNTENRAEKLQEGKTFTNIDECKLAFAKLKLVENVLNSKGGANVQKVFEDYDAQCRSLKSHAKKLDEVIDVVVKQSSFYNKLMDMDFKETLKMLDNSNIKNRKEFISLNTEMDAALKINRLGPKETNPSALVKDTRVK